MASIPTIPQNIDIVVICMIFSSLVAFELLNQMPLKIKK
jgi:hypothetical protein